MLSFDDNEVNQVNLAQVPISTISSIIHGLAERHRKSRGVLHNTIKES